MRSFHVSRYILHLAGLNHLDEFMIRGANPVESGIELDKLYFFIAVSVIDPVVATPARKSNAQISFSQIDPSLSSTNPSQQPISDPPTPTISPLSHSVSIFLVAKVSPTFSRHVLFYSLLSIPLRLRSRLKNCSR